MMLMVRFLLTSVSGIFTYTHIRHFNRITFSLKQRLRLYFHVHNLAISILIEIASAISELQSHCCECEILDVLNKCIRFVFHIPIEVIKICHIMSFWLVSGSSDGFYSTQRLDQLCLQTSQFSSSSDLARFLGHQTQNSERALFTSSLETARTFLHPSRT